VAARLRADGYRARTVVLKARLANFQTLTRSRTLPDPTEIGADLYRQVSELYRALPGHRRRIRLLGVQATGLVPAGAEQLALLHGNRWGDVERALDRIERRFGRGAARPASLIGRERRG
jgi:DNA polymerase-4